MTDDLPDTLPAVPSRRLLARVLRYMRPYAGWMAVSLTLLLGMSFALNYLPVLMKHAIDTWIAAGDVPVARRFSGLTHDGLRSEEHTSELQSQVYISRMPSSA